MRVERRFFTKNGPQGHRSLPPWRALTIKRPGGLAPHCDADPFRQAEPMSLACPDCGAPMNIIEAFERGQMSRAPPARIAPLSVHLLAQSINAVLIGSANMERCNFELNYENNILFYDLAMTAELRQRQRQYITRSRTVDLERVADWPMMRRLWNNAIAMFGPLL